MSMLAEAIGAPPRSRLAAAASAARRGQTPTPRPHFRFRSGPHSAPPLLLLLLRRPRSASTLGPERCVLVGKGSRQAGENLTTKAEERAAEPACGRESAFGPRRLFLVEYHRRRRLGKQTRAPRRRLKGFLQGRRPGSTPLFQGPLVFLWTGA